MKLAPTPHIVRIGSRIEVGTTQRLLLFAGPCQIESLDHCLHIAEFLQEALRELPVDLVFKSSFDKANRTSVHGTRGVGIDAGLEILGAVRSRTNLPIITDVHDTQQVAAVAQVVDVLQIPAFLCRQTDLLTAVGQTGKPVNVKKGQFLHPADMKYAAEKIAATGNHHILLCERGACFGYRDLVVDMRSLVWMRALGYPVIFDGTHSVQSMGGASGASGGDRSLIAPLVRAATAVGIDGLFIECHESPDRAPSDGPSMLPLNDIPALIDDICRLRSSLHTVGS